MTETTQASHMVVLQHGLYGDATSLHALQETLEELDDGAGELVVVVLSASTNVGRTREGIAQFGERLAAEVLAAAARQSSLRSLNLILIGSSLGSLYARHAASLLLDETGLMAWLRPEALVTLRCPRIREPTKD
jgi:pimeloyl-ACP methyl ester carboxylesterase|tara:strand:- start:2563 stop:2964 length:402 start_codon:yes stop_codon:yes gene_type:complete